MSRYVARGLDVQDRGAAAPWGGRVLLAITLVLVTFGLLSVYSASSFLAGARGLPDTHYLVEHGARAGVGAVVLLAARFVDYRVYRRLAWPLLAGAAVLLAILVVPGTEAIAPRINGARRWLQLGVTFQPSELAKVAVVVWTAALAVKKRDRLHSFRDGLAPFLMVVGFVCGLILLEPHLSAAVMVAALAAVVLYVAGARLLHFAALGLAAVPVLWAQLVFSGFRTGRMVSFLGLDPAHQEFGYQARQSLIAVGSGGAFGVGFGESRQKLHYLPEPQNDFIFSIIAEEWGFLGAAVLILLFLAWVLLGLRIARAAPDPFGRLLAVGLTAMVGLGVFAHLGVTLGLLPPTGVNLPFVSAGGTHLVMAMGATGILLNIASGRRH